MNMGSFHPPAPAEQNSNSNSLIIRSQWPANDKIVDEVGEYREAILLQSGGDIHLVAEEMRSYAAANGRKSISREELRALRNDRK